MMVFAGWKLSVLHVISRKTLMEGGQRLGCKKQLDVWFRVAQKAEWRSLADVRQTYASADGVTVNGKTYTVFNIAGNKFRLVVKIEYAYQKVFVKHEDWK